MKKFIAFLALLAIIAGGVLLGVAFYNGSFNAMDDTVAHNYDVSESFENIKIETKTSDVIFEISTDDKCHLKCVEREKMYHQYTVADNTLVITCKDEYKFYERWSLFGELNLTISLPLSIYKNLDVKTSTGDISFKNSFTFDNATFVATTGDVSLKDLTINQNLTITVTTGHIEIANVTADSATLKVSTGKVKMTDFLVDQKLTVNSSTGDIIFKDCDAGSLDVSTRTGDISGNLLTPKSFDAVAKTGDVDVPQNMSGGACILRTSTGDITIEVK